MPLAGALHHLYRGLRGPAKRALIAAHPITPLRLALIAARGRALNRAALVGQDLSFLYVVVPKAASSTIRRALWTWQGQDHDAASLYALHAGVGPFRSLGGLNGSQLKRVVTSGDIFRFTFVRNPYARLWSAYRDKILNLNGNHAGGYDTGARWAGRPTPSFAEFVEFVCAEADEVADVHWMSQTRCAMTHLIDYHLIGKVETFATDFAGVVDRLNLPEQLASIDLNRSTPGKVVGLQPFDLRLAEMVFQRYRSDFETFGYDRDSHIDII